MEELVHLHMRIRRDHLLAAAGYRERVQENCKEQERGEIQEEREKDIDRPTIIYIT